MTQAVLQIQDLRVELDTEAGVVRAVDGVSLTLQRGETFALVGESGCGKSMTAMALMRLLPESGRIAGGDVRLGEQSLLELPEAGMRHVRGGRIGMIFQEPGTSLNPVMRIGEQIVESIVAHTELRGAAARAKALEWLQRVGIPEPERRIDDYPFRLSGGQKQRVMIAIALAAEPDFLIADEPTTALDVTIQKQILDLLRQLQQEQGMGLLLITHDLAVVSEMAHQVALMYAGQIVEMAPVKEFFSNPLHPYARLLLRALPEGDFESQFEQAGESRSENTRPLNACRFSQRCSRSISECHVREPNLRSIAEWHAIRCINPENTAGLAFVRQAVESSQGFLKAEEIDSSSELLVVNSLSVRYGAKRFLSSSAAAQWSNVVSDVSFSVRRGESIAIVGESGSGKSTTVKAVARLLVKDTGLDGTILWAGKDVSNVRGADLLEYRRAVQVVFQDPFSSLNPRMRIKDIFSEGVAFLRPEWGLLESKDRIRSICSRIGMNAAILDRYPHEFSGGQRQRIAIGRALVVEPKLLICDEPTSALDVSVQAQIITLLRKLRAESQVGMIFVTHNLSLLRHIADRVLVMKSGRVVEEGPVGEFTKNPQSEYARELFRAVPKFGSR